jgi:hypothetical protein
LSGKIVCPLESNGKKGANALLERFLLYFQSKFNRLPTIVMRYGNPAA